MTERYCRACGAQLREGASYCAACGREIQRTAGPHDESPEPTAPKQRFGREQRSGRNYDSQWGPDSRQSLESEVSRSLDNTDATTLAALTHVLGLVSSVFGPLLVYILTDDPFVKENAGNALNWQIMFLVYSFVSGLLVLVLIGVFFLIAFGVANLAFCIVAAVRASEGDTWEYPLTPDLL